MFDVAKPYAKAIVAVLIILVATIGNALGVETGIDVEQWWQALGLVILTGLGVYTVPNKEE